MMIAAFDAAMVAMLNFIGPFVSFVSLQPKSKLKAVTVKIVNALSNFILDRGYSTAVEGMPCHSM